ISPSEATRSLRDRHELDADRRGDLDRLAGWRELAGRHVDSENDERAGVLILREEELTGRIDREVAGSPPLCGLVAYRRQLSGPGVDREDGDAVVAAVRAVEELARGVDVDLGR